MIHLRGREPIENTKTIETEHQAQITLIHSLKPTQSIQNSVSVFPFINRLRKTCPTSCLKLVTLVIKHMPITALFNLRTSWRSTSREFDVILAQRFYSVVPTPRVTNASTTHDSSKRDVKYRSQGYFSKATASPILRDLDNKWWRHRWWQLPVVDIIIVVPNFICVRIPSCEY